jgi:disulfide bond formation protein DsbB
MALSQDRLLAILAWVVIILIAGPVGGAVWLGLVYGDSPCILCWAQRTCMVLIALVGLFVLRYGPRHRYLGMVVLLGAGGVYMALRHSALHLTRDVGQGFSAPILGAHTYVWSWAIHWIVLTVIGVLLLLRDDQAAAQVPQPSRTARFAMGLFMVVVGANAFQAFASTGPPPFIGQSDPVRFSLNPRHWVRSNEETEGRISWRGSWSVAPPDLAALDPDPAKGPLAELPALPVRRWLRVGAALAGVPSDLAWDPVAGRFLIVSDRYEVLVMDSAFARPVHRVVLDEGFSLDLSPLAGAAFLGDTLAVLATNKSYVLLREDSLADPEAAWRVFRSTDGGVRELRRARFATVRARQMFVMSLAYDPVADELVTVSVPSARQRRLVVSRFARGDLLLSSEFIPALGPGLSFSGPDRTLADYVVTGATIAEGLLYAISAAHSTLLVIDPAARVVRAAYAVPGLARPTGLAARAGELYVLQADGRVAVIERPPAPLAPRAPSH